MDVIVQRPREGGGFVNSLCEALLREERLPGQVIPVFRLEGLTLKDDHIEDASTYAFLHKGFFDSHLHAAWMGFVANDVNLKTQSSPDDCVKDVLAAPRTARPHQVGYGWDENKWGLSLEAASARVRELLPSSQAIILYRHCGHAAFVTPALMRLVAMDYTGPFVDDRQLMQINARLPKPTVVETEAALLRTQATLLAHGITAIGDMSLDENMALALRSLCEKGRLDLDVQGVFEGGKAPCVENSGPWLLECSRFSPWLGRFAQLQVRHWKKYLDGSLGSRTAWLSKSYEDKNTVGEALQDKGTLLEDAETALRKGFFLSFHAIGDAATDQALEIGKKLFDLMKKSQGSRHRLEHVQVVRDDQLEIMAKQGFWAMCVQPYHRVSDSVFIEKAIGAKRVHSLAYRLAGPLDAGVPVCLSSDVPIDESHPEKVLRAAFEHPSEAEVPTREEALWWYTTGSRLALGLPVGELAVGDRVFLTR